MRSLVKVFNGLLLLMLVFGCASDDSSDDVNLNEQLMVEAYVFANEHVDHVKIARINDAGGADLIPVNDANIKISQGNLSANLVLKSEATGIYEISDPEFVFSGPESLSLEITYNGKTYTASTKFPSPIDNLSITNDYINITESVNDQVLLTTLNWTDVVDSQTYCLFARGIESDTAATYPIQPSHDTPLYTLHTGNSVDLYPDHFTHIGSYQLYVSAVNDEYMQMYSQNSAPELQGAPSNIEGAWGLFTAFNGQSVAITVE
ncbi:MAG: hypothetical protein ACJAZC_000625 [Cryomorphaceae bacterium]|jgi:hypothetical protein